MFEADRRHLPTLLTLLLFVGFAFAVILGQPGDLPVKPMPEFTQQAHQIHRIYSRFDCWTGQEKPLAAIPGGVVVERDGHLHHVADDKVVGRYLDHLTSPHLNGFCVR